MGYYSYQNGLIHRHLNQEGGWNDHLDRCRKYILKAVDHFHPKKITVLGSGWLLDLPLVELSELAKQITLVDIVHPAEVFNQARTLNNVEIKEDDVTGGLISEVWSISRRYNFLRKMKDITGIVIPSYKPDHDPGLIISLNVLTQLENLPVEYLKKKSRICESDYSDFGKEIQAKHIEFLKSRTSVLISDFEEIRKTNDGRTIVTPTLRTEIPGGFSREEWTWDFDLKGSDYVNSRSVMKVLALTFGE